MNVISECTPVAPPAPDLVTWIHIGDLHMVRPGEQNFLDLQAIVEEINTLFADKGVSFVYLPGDNADNGSDEAYRAVRECLDKLKLPWCAIVGDHDVQEKSFQNFQRFLCSNLYGSFTVGNVAFYRLNCFSEPLPDGFTVNSQQLAWLEAELTRGKHLHHVLLMHCYPSDLKQGGEALTDLIWKHAVQVVDMGHTHYNELSNDGRTIYCTTRSTGQVEEGQVGYSVVTLHGSEVSWHFKRLGTPSLVSITTPQDVRLKTDGNQSQNGTNGTDVAVRVLGWSVHGVHAVSIRLGSYNQELRQDASGVWTGTLPANVLSGSPQDLIATLQDDNGATYEDTIRVAAGVTEGAHVQRFARDQDNALGAWPERELLGTQLGPNKNGRKW